MQARSLVVVSSIAAALYIAGVLAAAVSARAQSIGGHDNGHAENHDWYKELKQPGTGYSCCNADTAASPGDCRPTRAYLQDDGTWRAIVNDQWVLVPRAQCSSSSHRMATAMSAQAGAG